MKSTLNIQLLDQDWYLNEQARSDTVDSSDGEEQTNDMTTSEVGTNPLSDAIIQNVTDELTAVGITDLGF